MAKKKQTPAPPRRVQAPKTRTSRSDRRTRIWLYGAAASGVLALVVVLVVLFATGGGGKDVAGLMEAAGCTYKTVDASVPKGQNVHVNSLTKKLPWNTFPPSNGQHYPVWAVWGFYTEPVNPRRVVHNLEHGGVVYWWGTDVPRSTVDALNDLYNDEPTGTFGTPIAGLGSKVAISAWTGDPSRYGRDGYYGEGHLGVCPRFDDATRKAFVAFRDAYRGKGPEGVPLSADAPGMGAS